MKWKRCAGFLWRAGYEIVPFAPGADVYVINTCTVTNIADRKSRQMLHKAKKMNPRAVVVAAGCYSQTSREAVEADPCVDIVLGNNRKGELVEALELYQAAGASGGVYSRITEIEKENACESLQVEETSERTRASLKVQDGCNQFLQLLHRFPMPGAGSAAGRQRMCAGRWRL